VTSNCFSVDFKLQSTRFPKSRFVGQGVHSMQSGSWSWSCLCKNSFAQCCTRAFKHTQKGLEEISELRDVVGFVKEKCMTARSRAPEKSAVTHSPHPESSVISPSPQHHQSLKSTQNDKP
jgi:hypothetical protein